MIFNSLLVIAAAAAGLVSGTPMGTRSVGCPQLPYNGGDHELPAPGPLTLKRIVLGVGVQNYTCTGVGAEPTAAGAVAMLYDITHLYPGRSEFSLPMADFYNLPTHALHTHDVPLTWDDLLPNRVPLAHAGVSSTHPFTHRVPLQLPGVPDLPFAGHHIFDSAGVPSFYLGGAHIIFKGKKLDSVKAPAGSDVGPEGTGSVAWLQVGDAGHSIGAKMVYRVNTDGGNSHGCGSAGEDTTTYATAYWFYG